MSSAGEGSCFIAGTRIAMADGTFLAIEDVQIGDILLGEEGSKNQVIEFDHPKLGGRDLYAINGGLSFVTSEHPFMTVGGWKSIDPNKTDEENPDLHVEKMEVGDEIETLKGSFIIIESIKAGPKAPAETQLYNFILDGAHSYYADGYLVHNKGSQSTPNPIPAWSNPLTGTGGIRFGSIGKFGDYARGKTNFFGIYDEMARADNKANYDDAYSRYNTANSNSLAMARELDNRESQITNFNTEMGNYNSSYQNAVSPLNQSLDFLRDADINSFDQQGADFALPTRSSLNIGTAATGPNFSSFQLGGNNYDFSDAPLTAIAGADETQQDLYNKYDTATLLRDDLTSRLDLRKSDNRDFVSGITNDIRGIDRTLDRGNFYEDGTLDAIFGDLGILESGYGNRQVKLDSFQDTYDALGNNLSNTQSKFDNAQGLYDTEFDNLNTFIGDTSNSIAGYQDQIGDLGIADFAQFDQYDNDISGLRDSIRNFDNKIGSNDLATMLSQAGQLDNNIDFLRDGYDDEIGRIEQFRTNSRGDLRDLTGRIADASMYNGNTLSSLDGSLDNMFDSINNYDSELDTDFSSLLANLQVQDDALGGIRGERTSALGDIESAIAAALQGGMDTELYNEDGIRDGLDGIQDQQFKLGRFSGGGLDSINASADYGVEQLDGRINDLNDRRDLIETNAGNLFGDFSDASYYNLDDVAASQSQFDELQTEADLYGSTQSTNELSDIENFLAQTTGRIETDNSMLQDRNNAEEQNRFNELFGVDRDYVANQFQNGNLSEEEYAILLGKVREKDPEFANSIEAQYQNLFS